MTKNRNRDRVTAESTVFHLTRLAIQNRCPVSQEQALVFFNQEGRAQEMWKHMMEAGLDFITSSLLRQYIAPRP